jgi:hypothetical protein
MGDRMTVKNDTKVDRILRRWRANEIGYGDAVRELVALGMRLEEAHVVLTQ